MKYEVLYNFISPVTGYILSPLNYVPYGNSAGIAVPSPVIIDIRLNLINLRSSPFIIGFPNSGLPDAQVLSVLDNGYMINTAGIISTIPNIPIGDLPNLTFTDLWIGDTSNRPVEAILDLPACALATDAAITAIYSNGVDGVGATLSGTGGVGVFTVDGVMPDEGALILVKNQSNSYENGIYELTDLGVSTFVLTRATFYDEPHEIRRGDMISITAGLMNTLSSWLETNIINTIGTDDISYIGPMGGASGSLPNLKFVLNDGDSATRSALPDAQFLKDLGAGIAKINSSNGLVEIAVPDEDYVTVSMLEGEVTSLEGQIEAAQAAAEAFATAAAEAAQAAAEAYATAADVVVLASAATAAAALDAVVLSTAESYTDDEIDALRLNNISASGDVSFHSHKGINFSDPTNPQDAATKNYVDGAIIAAPSVRGLCYINMSSNNTSTTVTTANTYYKILGTTTTIISDNFSASGSPANRAVYTGTLSVNALCTYNATFTPSGIPVSIIIYKNGVVASVSPMSSTPGVTAGNISITCMIPLVTSDYLEAFVTTATSATGVTVSDSNFTIIAY